MIVICPPVVEIGVGAVIFTTGVVPETNTICVVGAMVDELAMVGAAALVEIKPLTLTLPFSVIVEFETVGSEPMFVLVVEAVPPPVPIFKVFVVAELVAPVAKLYVEAPTDAVNIFTV